MRRSSPVLLALTLSCSPGSIPEEPDVFVAEPTTPGTTTTVGTPEPAAEIVPLYDASTELQPDWIEDVGDAIVTRFADRGRDRHAREDEFQSYDHYLPQYWEYRTATMRFVDYVAKGGSSIDVSMVSEWRLSIAEFRAWYLGVGTVATYSGNYAPTLVEDGPGTFDLDHNKVSDEGTQYRYSFTMDTAYDRGAPEPLAIGQFMEFEASQFLDGAPGARQNYYGTTSLYAVGVGGLVPWRAVGDFADPSSEREKSYPIDDLGWLGGRTTLPYQYSDEPDNRFMQMATNLSALHGQAFVRGRRVHHTDMGDGSHDESPSNPVFTELSGLVGPSFVHPSCDGCHHRNGRAAVVEPGESLEHWVFKIGAEDGSADPERGRVLQPRAAAGSGEGMVVIDRWEESDGLRAPVFWFESGRPARVSGRLAPQLVGMGLLEAIAEADVLAAEDPQDADGDGISGRAQRVTDPVTGEVRLGRFGWKAGATSLEHQIAAALNTDMGVMTSVLPEPDCGPDQVGCGEGGAELSDADLEDLVTYVALLGVPARRDLDDAEALQGEALFDTIGCAACHRPEITTSAFHPFAELRSQRIRPYTDLLLHDMGPGLADDLGEGEASGSEWRTPPLWGLGLGPCVTGGVEGPLQSQTCTPQASYLHDGRARDLTEAIRWHGGEAEASREGFEALPGVEQQAVLRFLQTL
ncbi:MAG: thiol oxidoreductase [Myxococcales bacterium]|nr:thiol oxidoreductase [Myxococcales bacterium]